MALRELYTFSAGDKNDEKFLADDNGEMIELKEVDLVLKAIHPIPRQFIRKLLATDREALRKHVRRALQDRTLESGFCRAVEETDVNLEALLQAGQGPRALPVTNEENIRTMPGGFPSLDTPTTQSSASRAASQGHGLRTAATKVLGQQQSQGSVTTKCKVLAQSEHSKTLNELYKSVIDLYDYVRGTPAVFNSKDVALAMHNGHQAIITSRITPSEATLKEAKAKTKTAVHMVSAMMSLHHAKGSNQHVHFADGGSSRSTQLHAELDEGKQAVRQFSDAESSKESKKSYKAHVKDAKQDVSNPKHPSANLPAAIPKDPKIATKSAQTPADLSTSSSSNDDSESDRSGSVASLVGPLKSLNVQDGRRKSGRPRTFSNSSNNGPTIQGSSGFTINCNYYSQQANESKLGSDLAQEDDDRARDNASKNGKDTKECKQKGKGHGKSASKSSHYDDFCQSSRRS